LQEQLLQETKSKKNSADDLRKQIDNLKTEREEFKSKNKELFEKSANLQRILKDKGDEMIQLQKKISEGLLREADAE
jgi:chromosome segregation ATPase